MNGLTLPLLREAFSGMDGARIALIGDICLDAYWEADMRLSELSRETPHYPLPVVSERYSPGGAGNAAACIAALNVARIAVCGVVGDDWRGDMLKSLLDRAGIDTSHLIRTDRRVTNAYIKPMRRGISDVVYEDARLDFENRTPSDAETERMTLKALDDMAKEADVICVSDQLRFGCVTDAVREKLSSLGAEGKRVIVDSRDRIGLYDHVIVKPNEVEATRAFPAAAGSDPEDMAALAAHIAKKNRAPALITLGEKGCCLAYEGKTARIPACPVRPPIDFCGAGDAFLAGFAASVAAGVDLLTAARIATLTSAVTIKKLGETGTASRRELEEALSLYG